MLTILKGGKWFCSFPKQHQDRQQIDNIWELVVCIFNSTNETKK